MTSPEANGSNNVDSSATLPVLLEAFPPDAFPLVEIGTGFSAQTVSGSSADSCAEIAESMLSEGRPLALSTNSSEGSGAYFEEMEPFPVNDLAVDCSTSKDGLLILRNERLFPGMVGIRVRGKGILWVREDGTVNSSGFFRRQIPKFEKAALVTACANIEQSIDVYHALFKPVLEVVTPQRQFKVVRTVLEAGLKFHNKEDDSVRTELLAVRRRVAVLRSQTRDMADREDSWSSTPDARRPSLGAQSSSGTQPESGEYGLRTTAGSGASLEAGSTWARVGARAASDESPGKDGSDSRAKSDAAAEDRKRADSDHGERSAKIAQQVVTGAPKQKAPFRLWKSKTGEESYDKKTPS